MKLFYIGKDGGPDSTVWGFWPVEIKSLFSIALLCFENGSREAFHNHAFNSLSLVLWGKLEEEVREEQTVEGLGSITTSWINYYPIFSVVYTPRSRMHKVSSKGRSWVLTFRGPWTKTWNEFNPNTQKYSTLMDGRKVIDERSTD